MPEARDQNTQSSDLTSSLWDQRRGPWEGLQGLLGGVPAMGVATPPPNGLLEAPREGGASLQNPEGLWPSFDPNIPLSGGAPSLTATLAERLAWLDQQWRIGKLKLSKRTRQRLRRKLKRELSVDRRLRRYRTTNHPKVVRAKERASERAYYHRKRQEHLAKDWLWKRVGIRGRYNHMMMKARERGLEFKLTIEELNEVLGPLDFDKYSDCIQVRRADTQRGFTKDNLLVVFWLDGRADNKGLKLDKFCSSKYIILYSSNTTT